MSGYRGAVLDLDGTVYRGDALVAGAAGAIERLRRRGLSLLFFSNNPTKTRADYVERLAGMGLEVREREVVSAGTVTTSYLAEHHAGDALFVVGSAGLREQFRAAGLELTDDPGAADVLVGSFDRGFGYDDMRDGYRALADGETAFVGTDPDVVVPAADGMVPGSGAIIRALAGVADREPDRVLGKPAPEAVAAVREFLGTDPGETLVVGDRLDTDIALGERAGATTVLVLTGAADRDDLADADARPDHVIDSLADLDAVFDVPTEP